MKARFDEEMGYLYIEDAQDGIKILSKDRYTELKRSADEADSLRNQLKELEGMKVLSIDEYNTLKEKLHEAEHRADSFSDMYDKLQADYKKLAEEKGEETQKIKTLWANINQIKEIFDKYFYAMPEIGLMAKSKLETIRYACICEGIMIGFLVRAFPRINIKRYKKRILACLRFILEKEFERNKKVDEELTFDEFESLLDALSVCLDGINTPFQLIQNQSVMTK